MPELNMPEFTKEMILVIHEDLIRFGGKAHGILYEATIDYILSNIEDATGVFEKAAWALYMSRQHHSSMGIKGHHSH